MKNAPTIDNIRLWDPRPLKETYSQIQEIRLYYDFNDVDVDRYTLNGTFVELMLSAREIASSQLPESAQNWINEHLVYTHGYGVVASPVNIATKQGLPELLIKDIPPESQYFNIERPEIYYGELTNEYVIVNTLQEEFDYPKGNENQYTTYAAMKTSTPLTQLNRACSSIPILRNLPWQFASAPQSSFSLMI
jgi:uncharacterized membrane protein (UPF0182 family)